MRLLIRLLVLFSIICISGVSNAKAEQYKVWYMPLDRNYYAPVTSENIEADASLKVTKTNSKIDQLFWEAEKKVEYKGIISGNDFRIKLMRKRDGKVLYINRDKSVSFEGILVNVSVETVDEVVSFFQKNKTVDTGK